VYPRLVPARFHCGQRPASGAGCITACALPRRSSWPQMARGAVRRLLAATRTPARRHGTRRSYYLKITSRRPSSRSPARSGT